MSAIGCQLKFLEPILGSLGSILIFSMALISSLYIGLGDNLGSLSRLIFFGVSYLLGQLYQGIQSIFNGLISLIKAIISGLQSVIEWFVNLFGKINLGKDKQSASTDLLDQADDAISSPRPPETPSFSGKRAIIEPVVKKPPLDPAMFKIIKGEKTEKSVASGFQKRRGDYVFPTIDLLQNAPVAADQASDDHVAMMEALVQTLDEFELRCSWRDFHGPSDHSL